MQHSTGPVGIGELLAKAHAGAWRADPPPLDLSLDELATILPSLIQAGSVGLVWPRLRDHAERYGAAGMALESAYLAQAKHNLRQEASIATAVSALRREGIDPVLIKGWSVSRLYPPPALRPAGDIDLVVPASDFGRAQTLLFGVQRERPLPDLDLQRDATWKDLPDADFRERTCSIRVGGVSVTVLCAEDQLRVACLHFIRHLSQRAGSPIRPIWLCDISLMLEARTSSFDWNRVLGNSEPESGWVITAVGLAHYLVGARIEDTPIAEAARQVPQWMMPAVVRRWSSRDDPLSRDVARHGVLGTLRRRWPDPLSATVRCRAPFNDFPRLPLQCAAFLQLIARYTVTQLPRIVPERMRPQEAELD